MNCPTPSALLNLGSQPTIRPWAPPSSPSGQIRLRNAACHATTQQPPPHTGMIVPTAHEKQDTTYTNSDELMITSCASSFPQLTRFVPCLDFAVPLPSANSYEARTIASYEKVNRITDHINRDKTTEQTYFRHLRNYDTFWDDDARAPERAALGGEAGRPITAYKATEFLDDEMNRAKRKRGRNDEAAGIGVGKSSLSQSVSALEYYRNRDQHLPEYQKNPESLIKLRDDPRIRALEKAAKHNEPRRIEGSLLLKAAGTSSDTYTVEEMRRMSGWYLCFPKKRQEIALYARDRAMTLLPGALAFRGDSTRAIQMSDIFVADIPMPELGIGRVIQALGILADNAKTNQQGRIDEHAALRHRLVDLCPVGALAFHLFAHFHILEKPVPNFAPDFTDHTQGEFGLREWYHHYLFSTKDATIPMSYDNHRERVNHAHLSNDVSITKVTHAGRIYAANTARKHGATAAGTKALGGWGSGEAFRQCYDRTHPKDAMIAVAMFDGNNPVTYFVARGSLVVPTELSKTVFPWIEAEEAALRTRERQNKFARDIALRQFLRMLLWFREVLLQDAAVLFIMYPDAAIWSFPPFNNATFRQFAIDSVYIIKSAEEEAQRQFQNLPEHLITSLRGIVTGISLSHEQQRQELVAQYSDVVNQLSKVMAHLELQGTSSKRRKSTKVSTPASSSQVFPPPSLPIPQPSLSFPFPNFPTDIWGAPATSIPIPHSAAPWPMSNTTPLPMAMFPTQQSSLVISVPGGSNISLTSPPLSPTALMPSPPPTQSPVVSFMSAPMAPTSPSPAYIKLSSLIAKYGAERLVIHGWRGNMEEDFLPLYAYRPSTTVANAWAEWADGLDGYLAVRILDEEWGAAWRRNIKKLRTEHSRKKKLVDLINKLSSKSRWSVKLALRFLNDRYGNRSARQLIDYITNPENLALVLSNATTYL